jgi:aminoglycoside phosphotransferase (APT) family kinase protein
MEAFRLPGRPMAMSSVAGGWSNHVYRLETTAGAYAVKKLLDPWQELRFQERLAEAWRFERAALAAGVAMPVPVPDPVTGDCTGPSLVRVHRWVDGRPAAVGQPVAPGIARWAGATLAVLHGLRLHPADRSLFPAPNTETADRWPGLTRAARRAGAAWADLLADSAPSVATVAALVLAGGRHPRPR